LRGAEHIWRLSKIINYQMNCFHHSEGTEYNVDSLLWTGEEEDWVKDLKTNPERKHRS
jgi:hypothetical protein